MKKILIYAISLLMILSTTGCANNPSEIKGGFTNTKVEELVKADMREYENVDDQHNFVKGTMKDIMELTKESQPFVAYLGFPGCPWCEDALPILDEVAKELGIKVVSINVKEEDKESEEYKEFMSYYNEYLDENDEGKKTLYVPFVIGVKNSKLVFSNIGTIDGHNAYDRDLTDEESKQLYNLYKDGIKKIESK